MPTKKDELDSFAMIKAFDYQKSRLNERKSNRKATKILGEAIVKYIFEDLRGETELTDTVEKHFVPAIQNTSADPVKNDDLIISIQNLIYSKNFLVEHPRYRHILQTDFEATFMGAVGGHSQMETAIANEIAANLTKKTRIHTFISGLRKALGMKESDEDSFWTRE